MAQKPKNGEISERKKIILKAVVEAHIAGGEPVGSRYILQNENLTCSSATIRNEMAELEALGFLEQPHTSAGRVPSELGYRFYVDSLIESYAMTAREISEINQVLKGKMAELDQILLTASKLAGSLTNYTSFAIKPKASSISIKRFDIVFVDKHSMVLVMISSNGSIVTKKLALEAPISELVASDLSNALNDNIANLTADEITLPIIMSLEEAMGDRAYIVGPIMKIIYECMSEFDIGDLRVSGMDRLLQYPEYSDKDQLRELLGALEEKNDILELVSEPENAEGINVVIGSESSVRVMNNSAIVYKPIVRDGRNLGAIGIIGPRRMDYAKVVATLEGLTGNIETMLKHSTGDANAGQADSTDTRIKDKGEGENG